MESASEGGSESETATTTVAKHEAASTANHKQQQIGQQKRENPRGSGRGSNAPDSIRAR